MLDSGAPASPVLWTGINGGNTGGSLDLLLTTIRACYPSLRGEFTKTYPNSYRLVWNVSQKVYTDMIASEGWATKERIDVPVIQQLTFKVGDLL
jgi:hypothetical protein